ncbi:hypothetical protein QKU48_gp1279 [Fadolivirus algeromassiliense]|jgi:hypothetical protein|uniref:Uncharacterized protein n=1 Tax=Fadolivirus FV1/VV64 TaxID=3070911 RepID=A0A7D3V975_9VIRU|nr:hypothetical protein QKU48_gp1279 [Fadolivirus algeromassiliense]QKF94737.1 hypothetical protein Fadolivirus_1_1279 [Fadolivirus FV1/VV64]
MDMISSTMSVVGRTIQGTLIAGAVVLVGAAAVSIMTKPSDNSFDKHIEETIKDQIHDQNDNFIERGAKNLAAKAVNVTVVKDVKDLGVVKVGHIKEDGKDQYFVGTLNTWIPIPDKI